MGFKRFLVPACVVATALSSIPVYAASNKEITSVYVRLEEEKVDSGEIPNVTFETGSNNYQVVSAEPSKEHSDWEPGRKVTFTVILESLDGYRFDKKEIDDVQVNNGSVSSQRITSSEIELRISYLPKITLAEPENIYFEDEYEAKWDEVEFANAYEVRIYEEDEDDGEMHQKDTVKVTKESIDLSDYVTNYMGITFEVRAVPKNSKEDEYMDPSDWVSVDDMVYSDDNTSYGDFYGDNDELRFQDEDGKNVTGWQQVNGNWYYFDSSNNDYAVHDAWKEINGYWYRFGTDCKMKTGWAKVNNWWYYLNSDAQGQYGAMATGWISTSPNGPWYYLDNTGRQGLPYGAMWANTTTPDGHHVDESGACYDFADTNQNNNVNNSSNNITNNSNGVVGTGITHKFDDGTYASGWTQLGDYWYYFDQANSNRAITNNWYFDGTNWFRFDGSGHMQTGWVQVDGYWYYLNPNSDGTRGAVMTGWIQQAPGSPWYYLQPNVEGRKIPMGAMWSNATTPDGFHVDASGAWVQ